MILVCKINTNHFNLLIYKILTLFSSFIKCCVFVFSNVILQKYKIKETKVKKKKIIKIKYEVHETLEIKTGVFSLQKCCHLEQLVAVVIGGQSLDRS